MRTSPAGLHLTETQEGFRSTAYFDSVGVKTIGFGTTSSVISPLPDHVTPAQGEALLKLYLARTCEPALNKLMSEVGLELNQNQFDALMDLMYNCGAGIISNSYQIGRDLRAKNLPAVYSDFMHYIYAGGRVFQDLVNRRRLEQQLWKKTPPAPPAPKRASGKFNFEGSYDHDHGSVAVRGGKGDVKSWGEVNEIIHLRVDLAVGPKKGTGKWQGKVIGRSPR